MALIRSVMFALIFYPVTVIAVLLAPLASLFGQPAMIRLARGWTRIHYWSARTLLGIETRVEGALPDGPVLIAAKHQAMYETLELVRLLGDPVPVLKRELADLPLWGRAARRYGVIPIDRDGSASALRGLLKDVRRMTQDERMILIFPEGTRVAPGEQPPLRAGFAGIYRMLGLPVMPVALDSGRIWPRGGFVKRPGIVTLRFGPLIPPGLPRDEAEARVHAAINALERPPERD